MEGVLYGIDVMSCASDQNLSEILFKPTRKSLETSFVSNSVKELPKVQGLYSAKLHNWFRLIHMPYWAWLGFDVIELEAALSRIAASKMKRTREDILDTVYEYGPGNWIYEFSMLGSKYAALAKEAESCYTENSNKNDKKRIFKLFRQAELYFVLASYPHLHGDELGSQALAQHYINYRLAAKYADGDFVEIKFPVDDKIGAAMIHTPDKSKKSPCVIVCSNYENLATEYIRFYQDCLYPLGIALVAIDMPAIGLNSSIPLESDTSKVHSAALNYIVNNVPFIDRTRIGILAQRFGGNCAVKLMLNNASDIRCAFIVSPVMHEYFTNVDYLSKTPSMIRATIANRLNFDAAQWEIVIPQMQIFSIKKQGILVGQKTDIPTVIIGIQQEILAVSGDLKLAASVSSKSEIKYLSDKKSFNIFNDVISEATTWLSEHLL